MGPSINYVITFLSILDPLPLPSSTIIILRPPPPILHHQFSNFDASPFWIVIASILNLSIISLPLQKGSSNLPQILIAESAPIECHSWLERHGRHFRCAMVHFTKSLPKKLHFWTNCPLSIVQDPKMLNSSRTPTIYWRGVTSSFCKPLPPSEVMT